MLKYKTIVTDYEAMQKSLDEHAAAGWRLVSVTPDTWRKAMTDVHQIDSLDALGGSDSEPMQEYCATYYLLVFFREDAYLASHAAMEASEPVPMGEFREI